MCIRDRSGGLPRSASKRRRAAPKCAELPSPAPKKRRPQRGRFFHAVRGVEQSARANASREAKRERASGSPVDCRAARPNGGAQRRSALNSLHLIQFRNTPFDGNPRLTARRLSRMGRFFAFGTDFAPLSFTLRGQETPISILHDHGIPDKGVESRG